LGLPEFRWFAAKDTRVEDRHNVAPIAAKKSRRFIMLQSLSVQSPNAAKCRAASRPSLSNIVIYDTYVI
jgi:hypothetical protein